MQDHIDLVREFQAELPFSLNLPEGTYPVQAEGTTYNIELLQQRWMIGLGPGMIAVGPPASLHEAYRDRWDALYRRPLQTLVRHRAQVTVQPADLPTPDENQLLQAALQRLQDGELEVVRAPEEAPADAADRWLGQLSGEPREAFVRRTSVLLAAAQAFPHRDVQTFCRAVNVLVRLYMAVFDDRFVQEISECMFRGTAFGGIRSTLCWGGEQIDIGRYAGGFFPFLVPGPWWEHPEGEVNDFRMSLAAGLTPDPVRLLHVRARAMLVQGAFRQAMIEASAAFDICLVRRIRAGYRARGWADKEIDETLDRNPHMRDRANRILREATGASVAEIDNARWSRFVQDRRRRGSVAHTEAEPTEAEATEAVENMIALAEAVAAR